MEAESELRNINQLSTSQIADLAGINTLKLPETGSPKPHHKRSTQSGPDPHEGDHREDKSPKKKHKKHHHKRSHHRSRSKHHDEELKVPEADDNDNGTITGFSPRENDSGIKEQNPKIPLSERTKAQTQPLDHNPEKVDEPSLAHTTRGVSRPQSDDETHILEEHESVPVKQKTSNFMNSSRISDSGNGTRIEFNGQSFHETELAHFLEQRDQHVGFTFKYFLAAFVYQLYCIFYSPFLMVPLFWLIEVATGGSIKTFFNLRLLGFNKYSYFNWAESLCIGIIFVYNGYLASIELHGKDASFYEWTMVQKQFVFDRLDFILIIAARAFIYSVKYGYYSPEHWNLFRNAKLPERFLEGDNVKTVLLSWKPEDVVRKIREAMHTLSIRDEGFKLKVFLDQTDSNIDDPEQIMERIQNPEKQIEFLREFETCLKSSQKVRNDFKEKYFRARSDISEQSLKKSARMGSSQVSRAIRFQKAFGKIYKSNLSINKDAQKIEQILGVQPTAEVPAMSILLEIYYMAWFDFHKRSKQISIGVVSFAYAMMPIIARMGYGDNVFDNKMHAFFELLIIIPKTTILYSNLIHLLVGNFFIYSKLRLKMMFLSLLDGSYANLFYYPHFLPQVNLYHPMNLETLVDMHDVLETIDMKYVRRSSIQMSCILIVQGLQAVIIYVQLIFGGKTVEDFGKAYVATAAETFFLVVYFNLAGAMLGAEANRLTQEIKRKLMAISQDFNRIKIVASQDRVFLRAISDATSEESRMPAQVFIKEEEMPAYFEESKDSEEDSMWGDVLSSQEQERRKQKRLASKPVGPEVMQKVLVLEETVEKKLDYVSYKLDFELLNSPLGVPYSWDFITSMMVVCGSILVTLVQKLNSKGGAEDEEEENPFDPF